LSLKGIEKAFQSVLNSAEKAYKKLHKKGSYKADDITQYSELIDETYKTFSKALDEGIKDNVIPTAMRQSLNNDTFLFSALKTHARLFEASRLLTNEDGNIKSFQKFSQDIAKLKKDYDQNYLEAEYQFAVSSAQNASKWAEFEADGDRYNLQYRTAGDDRVRDSHDKLRGITLPLNDPFWDSYAPQNGWRCRCKVIQVRKKKYPETDPADAMAKGDAATTQIGKDGKNRMEIFRFNPGKSKVVFPPKHPYRKIQDAQKVTDKVASSSLAKPLLKNESFENRYSHVDFKPESNVTKGRLEIFTKGKQNKQEFAKNKKALTIVANEGGNYRMLPVIEDGNKNPDAINLDTMKYVDVKVAQSKNGKSVIQNSIKEASKQKASELLLHLTVKPKSYREMYGALRNTILNNRAKSIKTIKVIFPDNSIKVYDLSEIKKRIK